MEKAFSEGKPGLENSYNQFTLYDGYRALLENCDKYWTEFYPQAYSLAFIFKKGDVDFSTRTGAYEVEIRPNSYSQKFRELMKPIETGLQKVWVEQWKDIPKEYPKKSIAYTAADTYAKTGVLTYNGIEEIETDSGDSVKNVKYRDAYEASWIASQRYYDHERREWYNYIFAGIEFNVCDQNGKTLVASPNRILFETDTWVEKSGKATLKNVNASTMELIDSKKITIKIPNMYLYYGKPAYADVVASAAYEEYGQTYYDHRLCSGKFFDHLAALSYKNPKVVYFTENAENLKDPFGHYADEDSDFSYYKKADDPYKYIKIIDIANKVKFAMLKAEDEKYTPLELEGFEFIRGNYTIMPYDNSNYIYYDDYYCDVNGNYKRTKDVKFIPSFYVDKESLKQEKHLYYVDWNELNEDADLPDGTLRKITKDEFEVLKTVHPELKDKSYNSYDDYLIVRSTSTVTKEFLEAQKNAPKLEKENKKITYFSDVQKNVTFTVKGKNLAKENVFAQFEGEEEKFYPVSVSEEKTAATFSVPVEKIPRYPSLYFYLNEKKKDFYYSFSGSRLNPRISQLSFDLDDGAPNLTVRTDCRFENVESAKDSLKFLLNKEEVSIKGIDYTSIILQTADVMNKVGTYKLELFADNDLAKSWDITVTDVVGDQLALLKSGKETLEISGTLFYDINKADGNYKTDFTVSRNSKLNDLLAKKTVKIVVGEQKTNPLDFYKYDSFKIASLSVPQKAGNYDIIFEIDGEKIKSGKQIFVGDMSDVYIANFTNGSTKVVVNQKSATVAVGAKDAQLTFDFSQVADLFGKKPANVEISIGKDKYKLRVEKKGSAVSAPALKIKVPQTKVDATYDIFVEIEGKRAKVEGVLQVVDYELQSAKSKAKRDGLEFVEVFQTKKGELYAVFNVGENAYKRLTKQNTDTESVYKYLSKKKNMVGNFSAFLDFDLNTSNYINIKDAKGKKVVKEVYRLANSSDSICVVAVFLRK